MPNDSRLIGYTDRLTARPGETVCFRIGTDKDDTSYSADIVRIRCADVHSDGPGFKEEEVDSSIAGRYSASVQRIDRGSRAVVPRMPELQTFTLQIAIQPTRPGGRPQAIAGTWDAQRQDGFALFLDEEGQPRLLVGGGSGNVVELRSDVPVRVGQWLRLTASYDAETGRARLVQEPQPESPGVRLVSPARTFETTLARVLQPREERPLLFAAWTEGQDDRGPVYGAHFDGKLEAPRLQRGFLSFEELGTLSEIDRPKKSKIDAVGWWDFAGDFDNRRFVDLSGNELHGFLENLPTRAVSGLYWDGSEHDWRQAPKQYAAIHFHADDLYDAGWEDSFKLEIPSEWKSGLYAARLRSESAEDRIPFFVAPAKNTSASRLAFLVPTATYLAYANMPDPQEIVRELSTAPGGNASERLQEVIAAGEFGPSCYHAHTDGSGVHHSSHLRPVLNMRPRPDLWAFNADTLIPDWLDELGFDYDIITDELLHTEGAALLEPYRTVVTGTHPEYTTTAMLDALEQYSTSGGRLVYLGANGFYWRVTFSDAWPAAIELRRAEDGTRAWESRPGEYHHAWGGELGGLWRRIGRPPNRLVGVGFAAQGFMSRSGYRRSPAASDPRAAFIFEGVDAEVFGAEGRGGGAAGEEIDRFDEALGSPPHALVLASAGDFGPDVIKTKEEFLAMVPPDPSDPNVRADLVFFETPNGGAVFSTGSIAWAGSLAGNDYDSDISRITRNVLRRFLDPRPFPAPE